jgi:hypothetical protein
MIRTRESFANALQAIFGQTYLGPAGEALGINERTMRRFVADDGPEIPEGVWADLAVLCRAHAERLRLLADQMNGSGFQSQVSAGPRSIPRRQP